MSRRPPPPMAQPLPEGMDAMTTATLFKALVPTPNKIQAWSSKANTGSLSDIAHFELALMTSVAVTPPDEIRRSVAALKVELAHPAGPTAARVAVKRILTAYRAEDAVDPKALFEMMAEAVEDFPACIVEELHSPKVGIIRPLSSGRLPPSW